MAYLDEASISSPALAAKLAQQRSAHKSVVSPLLAHSLLLSQSSSSGPEEQESEKKTQHEESQVIVKELLRKRREQRSSPSTKPGSTSTLPKHAKYRNSTAPQFLSLKSRSPARSSAGNAVDKAIERAMSHPRTRSTSGELMPEDPVAASGKDVDPVARFSYHNTSVLVPYPSRSEAVAHCEGVRELVEPSPARPRTVSRPAGLIPARKSKGPEKGFLDRMKIIGNMKKEASMFRMLKAHIVAMSQVTGKPYIGPVSRELASHSSNRLFATGVRKPK